MNLEETLRTYTEEFKEKNIGLANDGEGSFAKGLLSRYSNNYIPRFIEKIESTIQSYKLNDLEVIKQLICDQFNNDLNYINGNPKKYASTANHFVFFNNESVEIKKVKLEINKIAEEKAKYLLKVKQHNDIASGYKISYKIYLVGLATLLVMIITFFLEMKFDLL